MYIFVNYGEIYDLIWFDYFVFEKRFTNYTFFNVSQTMTNLKVFVILRNVLIGLHETRRDYLEQKITNRYLIFVEKTMTNR